MLLFYKSYGLGWNMHIVDWISTRLPPQAYGAWEYLYPSWNSFLPNLVVVWFQPILLRLSTQRILTWLGISTVGAAVTAILISQNGSTYWMFLYFLKASLPGFALIGARSRPWLILPAAALQVFMDSVLQLMYWLGRDRFFDSDDTISVVTDVAASVLYGAVLLYGTRQLRPSIQSIGTVHARPH
jgi:hypothetical protein